MCNRIIAAAFTFSIFTIVSCTIDLPDINPNTPEGAEMLIFEIADAIPFSSADSYPEPVFQDFYREYDIWDNGTIDLTIEYDPATEIVFSFIGGDVEVGKVPEALPVAGYWTPIFLPIGGLTGGTITGEWAVGGRDMLLFKEDAGYSYTPPFHIDPEFPVGLSYVPVRVKTNGQYFYGWLEFFSSNYNDADTDDFVLVSRFGVSQTPGLRIRMGQE